jgi:hypothetical protein
MPRDTTLEDFVESPFFSEVDNGQTRRISGLSADLGKCSRAMLNQAKRNLREYFAVVGTTEHFDETLLLMGREFSWKHDCYYYPRNTNPGRSLRAQLSPETFDAILARNEFDYELYQFAAELMDSAIAAHGSGFQRELSEFKAKKQVWYDDIARRDTRGKLVS